MENSDDAGDRTIRAYRIPSKLKLTLVDLTKELPEAIASLRTRVQEALLDPNEDLRMKALSLIQNQRIGAYLIVGGFALGDNLFLTMENGQDPQKIGYVSEIPAEYLERKTYSFGIVPEEVAQQKPEA